MLKTACSKLAGCVRGKKKFLSCCKKNWYTPFQNLCQTELWKHFRCFCTFILSLVFIWLLNDFSLFGLAYQDLLFLLRPHEKHQECNAIALKLCSKMTKVRAYMQIGVPERQLLLKTAMQKKKKGFENRKLTDLKQRVPCCKHFCQLLTLSHA